MKTFLKSSSPLKKLTIISENTVKNISIKIILTSHFSWEGIMDWKTKSYMRLSKTINVKKTKIIWKKHSLKIDEINSFFWVSDFEAFDAILIITLSEPSFKMLPKKMWKFLITPNNAIPAGPENTAIHLLITRPEIKINNWKELVEKMLFKLNEDLLIVLINKNLWIAF